MADLLPILKEISKKVQSGKLKDTKELVQKAIDEGIEPEIILNKGLVAGMNVISTKFKSNAIYVPEVLLASAAMKAGVDILRPYLTSDKKQPVGKVCLGTVRGDIHDIGKNIVKLMMECRGIEVIDLGVDVPPEKFLEAVINNDCHILCCSALLTTAISGIRDVVELFEKEGIRDKVKIMIGGAPINNTYCRFVGADVFTSDAASAAEKACELIAELNENRNNIQF